MKYYTRTKKEKSPAAYRTWGTPVGLVLKPDMKQAVTLILHQWVLQRPNLSLVTEVWGAVSLSSAGILQGRRRSQGFIWVTVTSAKPTEPTPAGRTPLRASFTFI